MSFLEENAKKEGVVTTDSGLQYKVLKSGDGKTPSLTDVVLVHYEGKLTNGHVFDSSIARGNPIEFSLDRVIAGWTEVLQLMKEGDEWEAYIPSNLAYGKAGAGGDIGPNEDLVFKINLLSVKDFEPVTITDKAVEEIKKSLDESYDNPEEYVLRVGVRGGGCSGFEYALGFVKKEELAETDVEQEAGDFKFMLDSKSRPYLAGTEIGYQNDLEGRGFVFNNPQAKRSCGCGSSFSAGDSPSGGGCSSGGCGTGCG